MPGNAETVVEDDDFPCAVEMVLPAGHPSSMSDRGSKVPHLTLGTREAGTHVFKKN